LAAQSWKPPVVHAFEHEAEMLSPEKDAQQTSPRAQVAALWQAMVAPVHAPVATHVMLKPPAPPSCAQQTWPVLHVAVPHVPPPLLELLLDELEPPLELELDVTPLLDPVAPLDPLLVGLPLLDPLDPVDPLDPIPEELPLPLLLPKKLASPTSPASPSSKSFPPHAASVDTETSAPRASAFLVTYFMTSLMARVEDPGRSGPGARTALTLRRAGAPCQRAQALAGIPPHPTSRLPLADCW
jgi:hypothetical protein